MKKSNKFLAVLLSLMMVAVFVPTFSFAAGGDNGITVYMTVSDEGKLATANDGSNMAWKEVTVTDLDNDGQYTFHEALVAAHAQYNDPAGYDPGSGFGKALWGKETTNLLFFINDEGISTGITVDTVANGDYLFASINKDSINYADWYSTFDKKKTMVTAGKEFTVTLKGHLGMAWTEEEKTFVPLKNIDVSVLDGGTPHVLTTTGDDGTAKIKFDEPGTYIVTAEGYTEGVASDWNLSNMQTGDFDVTGDPFGIMDWSGGIDSKVAYTDEDYGDGPYPPDEIKYIAFMEENEDEETMDDEPWIYPWKELNYLTSNKVYADVPIMAPALVVTVKTTEEEKAETIGAMTDLTGIADMDKYRPAQQVAVLLEIVKGTAAINAAATAEEAQAAFDAAVEAINGIITKAEYEAQAAKKVSGLKVTKGKKKATVKWTANSENFDGYDVYYKVAGKSAKTVSTTKSSIVVKGLKSKKKCTFKVRGYKTVKGVKVIGAWSGTKTVKIK